MRYILYDKKTGRKSAEFPEDMLAEIAATRGVTVAEQYIDWCDDFRIETADEDGVQS